MRFALLILLLLLASPLVRAQDTGGSFGGGFDDDSSSSSSRDGGGGGGSSGGGSSSGSSGSTSTSDEPMSDDEAIALLVLLLLASPFIGIYLLGQWVRRRWREWREGPPPPPAPAEPWDPLWLITAQLAIDWRARRALQETLADLARSGRAGTKGGRVELLRETVSALQRARHAWLHAAWSDRAVQKKEAQGAFDQATTDARSRFRREVVRDASGEVRTEAAPATRPGPADGPGVVVVSIFVASKRPSWTPPAMDAAALGNGLANLTALDAEHLVALEVVWSPAVETDRLSTAELEVLYPELKLIDPASVAGRVFCAHCTGPYAKELGACPHCGAPASA